VKPYIAHLQLTTPLWGADLKNVLQRDLKDTPVALGSICEGVKMSTKRSNKLNRHTIGFPRLANLTVPLKPIIERSVKEWCYEACPRTRMISVGRVWAGTRILAARRDVHG